MPKKKTKVVNRTPAISFVVDNIKPETSEKFLVELKQILKKYNNRKVVSMHIDGEGSKYLHFYTSEPALTVRISDHPTGNEEAKQVSSKPAMIAEAVKAFARIK